MPDKPKKFNFGLITVAGTTLAMLIFSEIVLAILDLPPNYQSFVKPPQFLALRENHPWYEVGYVNLAGQTVTFQYNSNERGYFMLDNLVNHRFNKLGFRGLDFSEEKQSGATRIAFFGDSFTMGEGVFFQDTYPQQTRAYFMRDFQKRVESLNFGVSAYNTEQEEKLISYILPKFNPDVLVLGYFMNDPAGRLPTTKEEAKLWDPAASIRTKYPPPPNIRLLGLGYAAWMNWISKKLELDYSRKLHDPNDVYWSVSETALHEIGNKCREFDIPCVAVLFPLLTDLQEYPLMPEHNQVKETLVAAGFVVLDVLGEVKTFPTTELHVHPTDHHPNELVHRLVGEKLANIIAPLL